jgi:hypothetical protein
MRFVKIAAMQEKGFQFRVLIHCAYIASIPPKISFSSDVRQRDAPIYKLQAACRVAE